MKRMDTLKRIESAIAEFKKGGRIADHGYSPGALAREIAEVRKIAGDALERAVKALNAVKDPVFDSKGNALDDGTALEMHDEIADCALADIAAILEWK